MDEDTSNQPAFTGDTLSASEDERLAGTNAPYQNWPGDVSILQVSYDAEGRMQGIETAAGGVAVDHETNGPGGAGGANGGTEAVPLRPALPSSLPPSCANTAAKSDEMLMTMHRQT